MDMQFKEIHEKLDKILEKVGKHGERIARVETTQGGFIKISTTIFTALVAAVVAIFKAKV